MVDWIKARLAEPSTWAALSGALAAIGVSVGQTTVGAICGGIAALLGIIMKEKAS